MGEILKDVLSLCCEVYIDDIIIYSENEQEHADHVQTVFNLIRKAGLSMKIEKCFFGVKTMDLLGYKFSADGMTPLLCVHFKNRQIALHGHSEVLSKVLPKSC